MVTKIFNFFSYYKNRVKEKPDWKHEKTSQATVLTPLILSIKTTITTLHSFLFHVIFYKFVIMLSRKEISFS